MSIDSSELRKGILYNMMVNEDYCRKVAPFVKDEYFTEKHEKVIFDEIVRYFNKNNSLPNATALQIEVESRTDLTEPIYNSIQEFLTKKVEPINKTEWLVNKTEAWCQERAIVNAVYQAVNVIGGDDKKTPMTALPELLHDAIATSFDKSVGHDYTDEADERWDYYNKKENKIETGLEHLDYILRGGIPEKTLGVIMAGTGVGKSLFMCSISSSLLERGRNVLYITMEMAEEKIAQRIDQNLLDMTQEELDSIGKESFLKRFQNLRTKTQGKLIVKEYPTGMATAAHFRSLLKELDMKKNFVPELICVDYLNICNSLSVSKNANSYEKIKAIAEELRALAMEFNIPVLTATQTNRQGMNDADVGMTDVSESFGLPMTADYFFAMTTNDQLRDDNLIRFSQLKNRYGDPADRRNWLLGVDYTHMKVTDIKEQPTHIEAQNNAVKTAQTPQPSLNIDWN
tara:strand:- start:13165 stop:14535 length:1371 start_codon:yes stop_codon:yes gene_type:complete